LTDNIPSVVINESGLCNYCADYTGKQAGLADCDADFLELLERYKDRKYQVMMAYSGGKDSTFTLKLLKEKYKASILAVTFNNGFLTEPSFRNISRITDFLDVDSIIVKYPACKMIKAFKFAEDGRIFPRISLERASAICNLCIMLIKNMTFFEAIIRDIPIICYGWTPGQTATAKPLLKLDYRMVSKGFENVKKAITEGIGPEYRRYFLDLEFMEQNKERIPYIYYPFISNTYNEAAIIEEIKQIGWELPENTDSNSSNCLLNSYANQSHIERFGYHPYAFEISAMIRKGCMTRETGTEKLSSIKNDSSFVLIKDALSMM
jgi:tRNA(Ile)-lysidine synthase TilS/MesJ